MHDDVRFGFEYSTDNVEEADLVGFDLCVLASADHSIHTYGSFGIWGSLLAGGDVIASKGRNNETFTEEDEIYLMSRMEHWSYIDTRDVNNITQLEINEVGEFSIMNSGKNY